MSQIPRSTKSTHPYHDDSLLPGLPTMDFREVFGLFLRKWWLMAICVGIAAGAAGYYLYEQPKLFESNAVLFVGQEKDRVVEIQAVTPDEFRDLSELKTVEQSLASSAVVLRVAKANGLMHDPDFVRPKNGGEEPTDNELVRALSGRVSASLRRGTRLIDLSVRDTDPERAKRLASSFVKEFTDMNYEQQLGATRRAKMALLEEGERLKMKLEDSERRLQAYRERYPDLPLDAEGNLVMDKLKALNADLSAAKTERLRLEADVEKLEAMKETMKERLNAETILNMGTVAQLPEVADLTKVINQKEAEFAKIKKRYLEKHPTYISAESELSDLKESLSKAALRAGENIRERHKASIEHEMKMAGAVEAQNALTVKMDEVLINYKTLAREVDSDQELYKSVMKRLKETDVSEGLESGHLRLMVTPMVSEHPVWPRKKLTMGVAILIGGVLGTVVILLVHWWQGSLMTSPQLERVLGIPALANVCEGDFRGGDDLVLQTDPQSPVAEAFRMLRSSLSFMESERPLNSVLFSSSTPDEGKSFCAANYALALAHQGHRTLLIDADLRRPTLGKLFYGVDEGPGLSNYLTGEAAAGQICRRTGTENLYVITAGTSKPNPAELLGNQRVINLVNEAHRWFDRIIIDTSPLGLVSDALPLARCLDAVCLVVRSGKTSQADVVRTSRYLEMAGAPLTGFVLNRVRQESAPSSYYYHYTEKETRAGEMYALRDDR